MSQSWTQQGKAISSLGYHLDHEPVFWKNISVTSHTWIEWKFQLSLNVQTFFNIIQWFPIALGIELPALRDTVPTHFPALISTTPDTSRVFKFLEHARLGPIPGPVHLLFPLLKIGSPPGFHTHLLITFRFLPACLALMPYYHTALVLNII